MKHRFKPFGRAPKKSHKKKYIIATLLIALAGSIYWSTSKTTSPATGSLLTPSKVPQFMNLDASHPEFAAASKKVFIANILSRMMEPSTVSEFDKVANTWASFLKHDEKNMNRKDVLVAGEILNMMRLYQEMKIRRKMNDPSAKLYWARVGAIFRLGKGSKFEYSSKTKATGVQLDFWVRA
jgi:hypothetical protein